MTHAAVKKTNSVNGTTGTAAEIFKDPETGISSIGGSKVTVTEKNALAFRILRDPEPYLVPEGYSIKNGMLLKDGEPACEQGEFYFVKILAKWADCMLLAARLKGMADDEVALVSYQVSRDRFRNLAAVPENIIFLGYAGEGKAEAVFVFSSTEEKEAGTDGEKKTMRCFKETALVIVEKGMSCTCRGIGVPATAEECFIKNIPGSECGCYEVFLPSDEEEGAWGCLEPRKERIWMRVKSWDNDKNTSFFTQNGGIRADWSPAYQDFVIRGKGMVRFKDLAVTSHAVEGLEGYDTLIDITREDYSYRLTFSNEEYGFKTLVSRPTRDRGYVVTVE